MGLRNLETRLYTSSRGFSTEKTLHLSMIQCVLSQVITIRRMFLKIIDTAGTVN